MLFIVLAIAVVWITGYWIFEEGWIGILFGLISALMAFVIWGPIASFTPTEVKYQNETVAQLRAMGNGDGFEGRSYFLGGGYVEDKPVINYIENREDGGVQLKRVDAESSTIYEVDEDPILIERNYAGKNWWISPFNTHKATTYEFRVPEGTVVDNYELSTK